MIVVLRTDKHDFGILIWKHVGTQKISTLSSKLGVDRYMHLRMAMMYKNPKHNVANR